MTTRIVVDPNSISRHDPALSVALLTESDGPLVTGQDVIATQPDEDGTEMCFWARVVGVSAEYGIAYLSVDWTSYVYASRGT